jgi:ankyrin repeat protein
MLTIEIATQTQLIAVGADVNAKNAYGRSAIKLARKKDNVEILKLLRGDGLWN